MGLGSDGLVSRSRNIKDPKENYYKNEKTTSQEKEDIIYFDSVRLYGHF